MQDLTRMNLNLAKMHVEEALRIFDLYDLDITEMEADSVMKNLEEARDKLQIYVDYAEREMEIAYLNDKFQA